MRDLQVSEVFKIWYQKDYIGYCSLINNLCEAVEITKRFLTKEKIDRQMTGQSSTPFMKLTDKKISDI